MAAPAQNAHGESKGVWDQHPGSHLTVSRSNGES